MLKLLKTNVVSFSYAMRRVIKHPIVVPEVRREEFTHQAVGNHGENRRE
jgi:hypothetical protein